ncbi:MAG: DUF2062 domain-containing protein [Polymorphobacter sp.]
MAWAGLRLPKLPSRDALLAQAWSRPFARYLGAPVLWRFNRRGVARGLALGLFVGIMIPLVQSPFAALFAVVARANLPIAVAATFVTNPLTTPLVLYAAYRLGRVMLMAEQANPIVDMSQSMALIEKVINWLATASLPTALGLATMATLAAAAGYFAVQLSWRWRIGRRWARRASQRQAAAPAAALIRDVP